MLEPAQEKGGGASREIILLIINLNNLKFYFIFQTYNYLAIYCSTT